MSEVPGFTHAAVTINDLSVSVPWNSELSARTPYPTKTPDHSVTRSS
jgi:hypothetical protein